MEYVRAPRAPQRAVRQPDRQAPQRGGTGRGRRRRRASRLLLLIGLLLAAAAAAVAAYVLLFAERERTVSMTATPLTAGVTRLNTGSGLLYQTEGHIHYYDWNDQGRNYTEGTATEDIRMSGSTFLSVVYTPTMLQIVGQEQPVAFTGEVLSVECGREHIAVLRRDSEGGESILVLSATGEQVDQLLPDDQYIVDFGFYTTTGEMLWMQTISSASGTPTTRITTYDLQRRTGVGVMQVQDQLIDGLYFTENSVFAAGTSQIIRYTHDGNKEIYREMVYGYRVLGRGLAIRTIVCTVSYSLFYSLIPAPAQPLVGDMLTGCLLGGVVIGLGCGIVLTCGASCGGTDVLGLYFSKRGARFTIGKLNIV